MTLPLAIIICISLFSIVAVPLLLVHRREDKKRLEQFKKHIDSLLDRNIKLHEIASSHNITIPPIQGSVWTSGNLLNDTEFTCHPSKFLSLIMPFFLDVKNKDIDHFEVSIRGLNYNKKNEQHEIVALTPEELFSHIAHILHSTYTHDRDGKTYWKGGKRSLVTFCVHAEWHKETRMEKPLIHYVKILETSEGFEEVDEDYLAAKQEVEAITAATRQYVNTRRIHE